MSDQNSYDFSEADMRSLSENLERCLSLLDETMKLISEKYPPDIARPFKRDIGKVIADLYLQVLEIGIYQRYPHLRPDGGKRILDEISTSEPRAPLDLSLIPTLQLLAEGLYGGRSGFIPELVDHEPVDLAELFAELGRRSGDSEVRGINDWIAWYLEPGRLSDGDRQMLTLFVKHKREFDEMDKRWEGRDPS